MRLKALLREPLLHFLAIGAAIFLYFHWSGGGSGPSSSRIVLTSGQVQHLAAGFTKVWQRPPTEAEVKGLIDDWVREEIAVREAMASGLDRDDTVIRRRLRLKLEFLLDDAGAATPPTEQELQAWLDAHAVNFRVEPEVALRQVFLSRERRGDRAEADAMALLRTLRSGGPEPRLDDLGDPTMLPRELGLGPRSDMVRAFGQAFADQVDGLALGAWSGPLESGYGLHLVQVRERVVGSVPPLALVRPAVERDFMSDRRRRQLATFYERLLEKYTVVGERLDAAATQVQAGKGGK